MKKGLVLSILFLTWPINAGAQIISETPLCISIYNATQGEVLGHVETAQYRDPVTGQLSWHRENFKIKVGNEERACTTGPFFDGYKLRVVVKTILPLYSCLADMNTKITIIKETDKYGFNSLKMDCPEEK